MPPFALILCSAAAVLGTLAATALSLDVRACVGAGLGNAVRVCVFRLVQATPVSRAIAGDPGGRCAQCRSTPRKSTAHRRTTHGHVLRHGPRTLRIRNPHRPRSRRPSRSRAGGGDMPAIGSDVVVRGRLEPFDDARNPGETSENAIERERGLDAQLEAATVLSSSAGSPWDSRTWLSRAHEWAHEQFALRLGEPFASVVAGELWGERSSPPPDLRAEFQETGTVHDLVTAGLHLGAVLPSPSRFCGCLRCRARSRASPPRSQYGSSCAGAERSCRRFERLLWLLRLLPRARSVARVCRGTRAQSPRSGFRSNAPKASRRPRSLFHSCASVRSLRARCCWNGGSRDASHSRPVSAKHSSFRWRRNAARGRSRLPSSSNFRPTPPSPISQSCRAWRRSWRWAPRNSR